MKDIWKNIKYKAKVSDMWTAPKLTKVMDREFLGCKCQLASAPDTCGATNNCGNTNYLLLLHNENLMTWFALLIQNENWKASVASEADD